MGSVGPFVRAPWAGAGIEMEQSEHWDFLADRSIFFAVLTVTQYAQRLAARQTIISGFIRK
jgi:hypothetical protein